MPARRGGAPGRRRPCILSFLGLGTAISSHRAGRGIGTLSGAKLPEGMRVRGMQAVGIVAPAGRVAEPTRLRKPDALAPAIEETGRFKVLSTDQHGQFR